MIRKTYSANLYDGDGNYLGDSPAAPGTREQAEGAIATAEKAGGHGTLDIFGTCSCGRTFWLNRQFDTRCDCGLRYNPFGQQLRDDREWSDYEIAMGLDN